MDQKFEDNSLYVIPQGIDNCINFLEETMEKGNYYRVFIKKMKGKEFFFILMTIHLLQDIYLHF